MFDALEHSVRQCGEGETRQLGANMRLHLDDVRVHTDESDRQRSSEGHQNAARMCSTIAAPRSGRMTLTTSNRTSPIHAGCSWSQR